MTVRTRIVGWALGVALAGGAMATAASHGIDVAAMDTAVAPGDDFYLYANGTWQETTQIPADVAIWGRTASLRKSTIERTAALIEAVAASTASEGSSVAKIKDFYDSFMNDAAVEATGLSPLEPQLDAIRVIQDKRQLAGLIATSIRTDVDALNATNFYTENLFGLWVAPGFQDADHYSLYLLQGGLGMPDREYYLADTATMADIRTKYQAHIQSVLELMRLPDTAAKAGRIFALEKRIATTHVSRVDSEDVHRANNPWTRADFASKAPGLDWDSFFGSKDFQRQPNIIVWHPSAVIGTAKLVASEPLEAWKDLFAYHLVDHYSPYLSKAFAQEHFTFYSQMLQGTAVQSTRRELAVAATGSTLGDAVGQLYVARYFPASSKVAINRMVANIKAAFARRIDTLEWMSSTTKAHAKAKVASLYVGTAYPDHWRDYALLDIRGDDLLGNIERGELFEYRRHLKTLGQRIDRTEWVMTPQTVNAVNLPLHNSLNFPAAFLQPPVFDPEADAAINYGSIGAIIGHEISHSFDDQGSQFDAHGRLVNWWTPSDLEQFKQTAGRLTAQYNAYCPFPDLCVNGQQTLSENIADLAGLAASFDAWRASLGGKATPQANGFTGEQEFFLSNAQQQSAKMRDAALRRRLLTDGHAPGMYRASTVRNMDAWYEAFAVRPGQTLYLAPADRIRVW